MTPGRPCGAPRQLPLLPIVPFMRACALSLPGPMTLGTGVPLTERHDKVHIAADQCSVGSVHGLMVAEA